MESPILLCIETSSPICSVALGQGSALLDEIVSIEPNGHSKLLALMIRQLLDRNQISFENLAAVAINSGPGSYTGLRIGMSTAKGICYAAEKPLVVIPAFESMVNAFLKEKKREENALLLPMIDARRMEVYTQVYDGNGFPLAEQKAYISGEGNLLPINHNGKVFLFGSGAEKMLADFSNYDTHAFGNSYISASSLIDIAYKRWLKKQFDDVAYTTPNYGKAWQKA